MEIIEIVTPPTSLYGCKHTLRSLLTPQSVFLSTHYEILMAISLGKNDNKGRTKYKAKLF